MSEETDQKLEWLMAYTETCILDLPEERRKELAEDIRFLLRQAYSVGKMAGIEIMGERLSA